MSHLRCPSVVRSAFAWLALSASPLLAQAPLATDFDCLDGKPSDIAAQRDAGLDGFNKRAWIAQGRVRKAIRLSNRERVHAEDAVFDSSIQAYPYGVPPTSTTAERQVALEVNEDRVDGKKYLYTLTEVTLYREDISDPSNPTDLTWLPLVDICTQQYPSGPTNCNDPSHIQDFEEVRDIKVWNHPTIANRGKVILLTSHRVVVIKDKDWGLVYKSSADELYDEQVANPGSTVTFPATTSQTFNDTLVYQFWKLRVADDGGVGGAKAYVMAEMGSRKLPGNVRGANMILVCDLDTANLSLNPTFDRDADGDPATIEVAFWDPFQHAVPVPTPPNGAGNEWNDLHTVNSLEAIWDNAAGECRVYAACGEDSQVQRLDATDWFALGATPATTRLDVDPTGVGGIVNVLADPGQPGRFLAMRELGSTVAIEDLNLPGSTNMILRQTVNEPNVKKGSPHDQAYVENLALAGDASVWTTGDGRVDHVQKVIDFSASEDVLPTVGLVDEYPGLSSSDGGIYLNWPLGLGGGGEIYLPTFGGVLRYTPDGAGGWRSEPTSYQPAEKGGPGSGIALNTEHIDFGLKGGFPFLFTVAGTGEVLEYAVQGQTRDLDVPVSFEPNPLFLPPTLVTPSGCPWVSSWEGYPEANYYSNDLCFLAANGKEYVLTILTDFNMVEPELDPQQVCRAVCDTSTGGTSYGKRYTQHAVLLFEWDDSAGDWTHIASTVAAPLAYPGIDLCQQDGAAARLAHVIAVAPGSDPTKQYAFVGHHNGFFSVELDTVAGTLTTKSDFVLGGGRVTRGIVANEDRLFVWTESSPPELRIYTWDTSTGVVDPGIVGMNGSTPENLGVAQYVMNSSGGLITGQPGQCFRMRYQVDPDGTGGAGHLLAACEPRVFKFAWPGPGGSDTLGAAQQWVPPDYAESIQDCRVFDMEGVYPGEGLKILAVKNAEAFSVVDF